VSELDDILVFSEDDPVDRDLEIMFIALGQSWPRRPVKKQERKQLQEAADEIAIRKLTGLVEKADRDLTEKTNACPTRKNLQNFLWNELLFSWLERHLPGRKRRRGRARMSDELKTAFREALYEEIKKDPNRSVKQIRGEVAQQLGISDARVKQLDPTTSKRIREVIESRAARRRLRAPG
jgi:hypothetical protein